MAVLDPYVKLTRISDSGVLEIKGNAEVTRDANANLTVSWSDPLKNRNPAARLLRSDLVGFISEHVEQQRNRAGAYLVITDPGGCLLHVTWKEIDPWAGALTAEQELYAVAAVGGVTARVDGDSITLAFYRADYRFGRGSGLLETRPAL